MRATPYARATSGGSAVPADEAERERAIRADWISADGGFANDAFIKSLLSSAAPKLLHEQLRKANYNTREGEGKASRKCGMPGRQERQGRRDGAVPFVV